MEVTFHGVRGSCPCPSRLNSRYGANTASVVLREPSQDEPLLLDLGTGLHGFAATPTAINEPFRASALVTHLHFDHVQGLPFFPPIHAPGSVLDVYAPAQTSGTLAQAFQRLIEPPYFPVRPHELGGEIVFHDVAHDDVAVGWAKVMARPVPHVGPTVGYRIESPSATIAYISDHQAPVSLDGVDHAVLELCRGADLLIHDAQYTPEEFAAKSDWGHSTFGYAVQVAAEAGVRQLCLFHHDPMRSDDQLDGLLTDVSGAAQTAGIESVIAASEGLVITV